MSGNDNQNVAMKFGVNIWWTCPSDIKVDVGTAQAILARNGFESEHMPVPSERAVLSRAAYSFQDRRHQDNRRITEKASENGKTVTYGILSRNQQDSATVDYTQSTTIKYDKDSNRTEVTGPLAEEFLQRHESFRNMITDDDIRAFMRRVIRMCFGIAKRPTGGIYFVPAKYVSIIESARNAIAELKVAAKLYVERIHDGLEERANVWEAAEDEITKRIEDTLAAVSRIEKRASALDDHAETLKELNELMKVYTDLLGDEAKHETISEKLRAAAETVAGKMAVMNATAPVKAVKVAGTKMNLADVAYAVLKAAGKPMDCDAIVSDANMLGIMPASTSPVRSMATTLSVDVKSPTSLFVRASRGMYALKEVAPVAAVA